MPIQIGLIRICHTHNGVDITRRPGSYIKPSGRCVSTLKISCPGFEWCGNIECEYDIPICNGYDIVYVSRTKRITICTEAVIIQNSNGYVCSIFLDATVVSYGHSSYISRFGIASSPSNNSKSFREIIDFIRSNTIIGYAIIVEQLSLELHHMFADLLLG